VRRIPGLLWFILLCLAPLAAQEPKRDMQVRINYLNVCNPSDAEKQEIAAVLERIPTKPGFGPEFEVARGRSTMPNAPLADWVRIRREFPAGAPLTNVQYSFSADSKGIVETMVFRWRDPKDVLQVSIEDSVSAVASPAQVVATDTPASRVRVERFGKNSLGLARCENVDQKGYEPLFASASTILARYRAALGVRQTVPGELEHLAAGRPSSRAARKSSPSKKK